MNRLDFILNFLDYTLTIVRSSPRDIVEYQKIRQSIRVMQAADRDPEPREIEKLNDFIVDLRNTLQAEGEDTKFLPPKSEVKLSASLDDINIMARTLYGESEKDNKEDAEAIAWVIRNRLIYKRDAWGLDLEGICKKSTQFKCWDISTPESVKKNKAIVDVDYSNPWFRTCTAIAGAVIKGEVKDPTNRSTHYLINKAAFPVWARDKISAATVHWKKAGVFHAFFNNIDTPPPPFT